MKPTPLGSFFHGENRVLLKLLLQNQTDLLWPGHAGTGSGFVKRRISTTQVPIGCMSAPETCAPLYLCHRVCRATHDAHTSNTTTPILMQPNWKTLQWKTTVPNLWWHKIKDTLHLMILSRWCSKSPWQECNLLSLLLPSTCHNSSQWWCTILNPLFPRSQKLTTIEPISTAWQISQHLLTSQTQPQADYLVKRNSHAQHVGISKAVETSPGSRSPCPGGNANVAHGNVLAPETAENPYGSNTMMDLSKLRPHRTWFRTVVHSSSVREHDGLWKHWGDQISNTQGK